MANNIQNIKWGIIGCGDVTEVKSGPAFNLIENSELHAVMRRTSAKAEDYAQRHNVPNWFSNADELINNPEVNAIYVATPPETHAEYAIKAMRAGKPVYVEKPMALNYEEAKQMIAVAEETKVPLFVAYYRRALPGFLKVKQLIEDGAIGQVRTVNIQLYKAPSEKELGGDNGWRVDPKVSGGGHFVDLASHQLDYLDFLFGGVKEIKSFATNQAGLYEAEDFVSASLIYHNNIVCTGTWCFSASAESNRDVMEIVGDKGVITFSCFGFEPIQLLNHEGIKQFQYPKPKHVQIHLIEQVVKELSGTVKLTGNAESAARTTLVMEKVLEEYYINKSNNK